MFTEIVAFILKYKFIFIFYLALAVFLFIKRKKIQTQAKIILLYRTKWGLQWMEKYSQKFRQGIILIGYIGVGAGYIGLIFISYTLVKNLYDLLTTPATVSGVSLVLPGVNIPGMGVLPFWYWILAILIIAIVHEFSHGIVARAHNIPVKNTGMVVMGPVIGAFVEPDEEQMKKEKDIKQYSVLAAGSFSNILLALVAILLLNFIFLPLQQGMVEPTGFTFDAYFGEQYPFAKAGIKPGTLITGVDNIETLKFEKFNERLICTEPQERLLIKTPEKNYPIILAANPDDISKPFLGIKEIRNEFELKDVYSAGIWKVLYNIINWIIGFLKWLFLLSLGIGLFNLLPLPIVDGGRMVQVYLHKSKGKEKGEKRYRQISLFFLLVLLLNLFYPLLIKLF